MAYDEKLAERIRLLLLKRRDVSERKMFGGIAFLAEGHMFSGVVGSELMVRVGADGYAAALARPHVREMDFTGRPLRGMVYVEPAGIRTARQLEAWLTRGLDFVRGLPAK